MALRTELKRKEMKDDPKRTAELAAYFTHAKLQPVHQASTSGPAAVLQCRPSVVQSSVFPAVDRDGAVELTPANDCRR